jgi:hypothetical protein
MVAFEKVCEEHSSNLVVVVGNVNSTLACSVVAECEERGEESRGQAWLVGLLSGCCGRPYESFGAVLLTYAGL